MHLLLLDGELVRMKCIWYLNAPRMTRHARSKRKKGNELERGGQSGMKSLMNGDGSERQWQGEGRKLCRQWHSTS
jgi:hypothetical protein